MKKISITLFLCALFSVSCSSDSSNDSNPAAGDCTSTIPFLATGKSFTYKTTQFGFETGTLKYTVGACNGNGFLASRQVYDTNGVLSAANSGTDLWKQDGDFLATDSNNNGDYFAKIYKRNATLGETWVYTRPTDGAIITHQLVDLDSLITVPLGSYHCKVIKYTNSATINESHIFWVDDLGQIKEDADGFFVLELTALN